MRTNPAFAVGALALSIMPAALAQDGHMLNGTMWGNGWMGDYGNAPMILLLVVVVGLVVWLVKRGDK